MAGWSLLVIQHQWNLAQIQSCEVCTCFPGDHDLSQGTNCVVKASVDAPFLILETVGFTQNLLHDKYNLLSVLRIALSAKNNATKGKNCSLNEIKFLSPVQLNDFNHFWASLW